MTVSGSGSTFSGGTLDGVAVSGSFQVAGNGGLTIKDGLTLNGTATLGASSGYGDLAFSGSQTLGGSGTVVFGSNDSRNSLWVPGTGNVLTLGPNVTVHGLSGNVGFSNVFGGNTGSVINQKTYSMRHVRADHAKQRVGRKRN